MMQTTNVDVVVAGGGLVGRLLAHALTQSAISVALIDKAPAEDFCKKDLDGRTTAVSLGSAKILAKFGLWDKIAPQATPILEIRVFENGSPWTVDYHHSLVGPDPMGYIVENQLIKQALALHEIKDQLIFFAPHTIETTNYTEAGVTVTLDSGDKIEAKLLVGAEGRVSSVRAQAHILTKTQEYDQHVLVMHLIHEKPHQNTAWEIFTPQGPLAFLPMTPCPHTGNARSGIVWGKPKNTDWLSIPDEILCKDLEQLFPFYGKLTVASKRWTYPLMKLSVNRVIDHRTALVGDAAHVMHPIAGQGVNVGWRDVERLATLLSEAKSLGLDLGQETVLSRYNRLCQKDHRLVMGAVDGIHRLFNNDSSLLYFMRNTGFALVNNIPPLKRFFARKAMGV